MKEKQSDNRKRFLEIRNMVTEKNVMPVNMLKNKRNMAKDQISVWKYQSKEILQNMELKFFSKKVLEKKFFKCFRPPFPYQTRLTLLTKMNSRCMPEK